MWGNPDKLYGGKKGNYVDATANEKHSVDVKMRKYSKYSSFERTSPIPDDKFHLPSYRHLKIHPPVKCSPDNPIVAVKVNPTDCDSMAIYNSSPHEVLTLKKEEPSGADGLVTCVMEYSANTHLVFALGGVDDTSYTG